MTKYVLGFFFSEDRERVLLIKKNRPEFLRGKLNGIGGHLESAESPLSAMQREFHEETGILTKMEEWIYYGLALPMQGEIIPADLPNLITTDPDEAILFIYYNFGDLSEAKSMTDEIVYDVSISELDNYNVEPSAKYFLDLILEKYTLSNHKDKITLP